MAGLSSGMTAGLSRQQLSTIAWLRWRLLMSAFRRKGATGEIVARVITYPILACIVLVPATGAGFAGYYLIANGMFAYLPIPLWVVFFIWQFVGLSASVAPPSFDLTTLTRFPLRYRDYMIVRLSFGLLDLPTLIGGACLIGLTVGIGIADLALLPWAALVLFLYAVSNILFSRMLFSWLDKWLANRKAREFIGVFFLLFSLSFQMLNPIIRHFTGRGRHSRISPGLMRLGHALATTGKWLPPGLSASSIAYMHRVQPLLAVAAMGAVLLYAAGLLYVLNLRLHAQYLGENLSEAPVARMAKRKPLRRVEPRSLVDASAHTAKTSLLPAVVSACIRKEIRYLARSGPMLYSFVTPLIMVFVFSARSMATRASGKPLLGHDLVFAYGCAYLQFFLTALLYNCFGNDGAGVQFYFFAPIRIRDVVFAKNIVSGLLLVVEVALIYLVVCLTAGHPLAGLAVLTLSWVVFTYLVGMTFGNLRSLYAPKKIQTTGARTMRSSGMSSLISLAVLLAPFVLGTGAIFICRYYAIGSAYWIAAAAFLVLTAFAAIGYVVVLGRLDAIALERRQDIAAELCKA
jgi:ABC-2 type transport system permease protein